MDLDLSFLTTELSTMAGDFIMSDLSTATLFIYAMTLDDIIQTFSDFSIPYTSYDLSEMSGTMNNLT